MAVATVLVLLILVIILCLLIYIWWLQEYSPQGKLINKIPGAKRYPIIGNLWQYFPNSPESLFALDRWLCKKYYPIFSEWMCYVPNVSIQNPDDVELILGTSQHLKKGDVYQMLHKWLGTGLLTSDGSKWHSRRKILTPAFHFTILQQFVPIFNEETSKLIEILKREANINSYIDIVPPVSQFTLLSIAETSMGIKLDSSPQAFEAYKNAIYTFGANLIYRSTRPWLYIDAIFDLTKVGKITTKVVDILHTFSRNVISARRRTFDPNGALNKRLAMLDLLLKDHGVSIEEEGIREEVDTFMFEGHDTTALAIVHTLLLLANHPKIQEEVYEEIVAILGHTKPPTYTDLKQLSLMERCIKESLRLFPSVPFISRKVSCDVTTATGYIIPKDTTVNVFIYDMHRNPEHFSDPEKFDPDRFLPDMTKKRHPFSYLPFSAGPRNCIGQKYALLEIETVLCGVLREFILEPVNRPEDVVMQVDLVLRPKGPVKVGFRRRVIMTDEH